MAKFKFYIYNVNLVSLRQAITPKEMQGKVNASMRFLVHGVMPFGALAGGLLGELIGIRGTLLIAGAGGFFAFPLIFFSPVRKLTAISDLLQDANEKS